MKRDIRDPSTTTEADRALRLRKDLADAQARLREAEQWREQASKASKLERELADAQAKLRGAEQWREQASKAARLEREVAALRERVAELEGQVQRLRERPSLRQLQEAEGRAQAKLNRRLFQENERLKQEVRSGL